ncbi:unnamed protein product [Nippostrongylus brasiliensis]|uniref:Secreted protein n=1 Tax=Nippostrongylus brasiliensis TaxID=27835 RepID=A0A0N4YSG8_NIPBR|nr:unnamed protein product [Nippostrongylus brasiliensis]
MKLRPPTPGSSMATVSPVCGAFQRLFCARLLGAATTSRCSMLFETTVMVWELQYVIMGRFINARSSSSVSVTESDTVCRPDGLSL